MRLRFAGLLLVSLLGIGAFSAPSFAASISGPSSSTTGTFTLTWTAGYYLADGAGLIINGPPATAHTFTDLPTGTYTYQLMFLWEYWDEGGYHAEYLPEPNTQKVVTVTRETPPPPVPAAITGPTTDTDGAYTISWGISTGATSYELQEQTNGGAWSTIQNTVATSKAVSGKTDATWGYRVRGCIGTACSAWTATHSVTVLNTPGVPGAVTGPSTDADGTYTIAWTAASGTVTRYELEERLSGGSFAQIQSSLALDKSFVGKIDNTYEYRVRACNVLSCGAYTAIKSVQVTGNPGNPDLPNVPPAPQVMAIPSPSASSDGIGVVPGAFRVDAAGAATYSIPIATVPGSGGVAPVVSLDYSSQAGNGIAGVGWRLSGASVISRCRQTKETDDVPGRAVKFDANDRFCLDGQRLMVTTGTYGAPNASYRTEVDSFAKVVSYGTQGGGPLYFKVWRKDGSVSEYGNTATSRIESAGANSTVYAWAQNTFTDSIGNYFTYQYVETSTNGVEFVLDKILYTGNTQAATPPYAELRFVYDTTRPDKTRGYFAGMAFRQSKRLSEIQSWSGATQVRSYAFDYEPAPGSNLSRLSSVTLCGPTVCLEPTRFTWQDAGEGFELANDDYYTRYFNGGKPADVDGDGDADLVWLRTNNSGEPKIEIMRSEDGRLLSQGQVLSADSVEASSWQILDYNNDGKHDLLLAEGVFFGLPGFWKVRLGGTDANGDPTFGDPISTGLPPNGYTTAAVADFNGDGLSDFIYTQAGQLYVRFLTKTGPNYALGAEQTVSANYCAPGDNCSSTFSLSTIRPIIADFNGDGMVDLMLKVLRDGTPFWRIYTTSLSGSTLTLSYFAQLDVYTASNTPKVSFGDWNGDGLLDVAYAKGSLQRYWYYRTSTGTTLTTPTLIVALADSTELGSFADYNGDGRQDFLYTVGGTWYARLAVETGLSSTATSTGLASKVAGEAQYGWVGYFHDINGDGRADYSRFFLGDDTPYTEAHVRLGQDPFVPANVVTAIENGFGARTEIEYQALNDPAREPSYFAKSSDGRLASWGHGTPTIDLLAPIYTVKRVQASAPAAGSAPAQVDPLALSAVGYRYAGAKLQGGGRGFLGFAAMTTVDEQTGIESTTHYRQDFPFIGLAATTEVKAATGETLARSENTWLDRTAGSGPFRQPYLAETVEYRCDLATAGIVCDASSGALLTTVTTTTTVDDYGNALIVNVTTTGAGSTVATHTTNTFSDDVANWKLGRLTAAVVVHSRTGQPDVTRTASFRYTAGSKMLDQETTEPDGAASETLTTTYTLDAFGNRRVATVTGWDGNATVNRTTTLTFDSLGRFANERRNAYNQLTEQVLARNLLGQPTQLRDIAQVTTDLAYGEFGQEYFRRDPTGAWIQTEQALCTDVGGCPDAAHYRSRKTVAGGGRSDVYFDVLGREVRTTTVGFNGTEIYVDTEYDTAGRVARKSEPYFAGEASDWTEFSYDVLGRVTSVRHPDYPSTGNQTTSDYAGFVTTLTNGKSQQKIETRNAVGELIEVEDALGNTVTYTYDATGNLTSSTQSASDTPATALTTLTHDTLGRKTALTDADMGSWSYSYNAFGELIQQNTAIAGKYTTVRYDLLGRMTSRIDYSGGNPQANAGWLYDACSNGLGRLCREDTIPGGLPSPTLTRAFGYDVLGRPSTVTTTINAEVYSAATTYDAHGRVFQAFDGAEPYSGLEYQYTADGHLRAALESRGSASVSVERYRITGEDARGQVTGLSKGGIDVSRSYAKDTGRLQSIYAQNHLAVTIQDLAFEFDVLGNLTEKVDAQRVLAETYAYDALNRLTAVTGSSTLELTYDGLGNIDSKSDVGSYGYGTRPHAATSAGSRSFSYDGNGNLIAGSDGRANSYTVFNKPYAMSASGNSVTIDYGPNRERYRRIDVEPGATTTTHYVGTIEKIWRPGGVIQIRRYLDGEAIETLEGSTRTTEYLFTDQLGSVDVITNASGTIVQSMAFDAFGRRRDAVDYDALSDPLLFAFDTTRTTRGFTFHEQLDPVGLIHMNGRVYDPTLGRFLSADPFVQDPSSTQSLNRYSYVFNNPLSATDPSGYFSLSLDFDGFDPVSIVVHAVFRMANHYLSRNGAPTPGSVSGSFGNGAPSVLSTGVCGLGDRCLNITGSGSTTTGDVTIDRSRGGSGSETTGGNFENGAGSSAFSIVVDVGKSAIPGYDVFQCFHGDECSTADWTLAVVGVVPNPLKVLVVAGKAAKAATKVYAAVHNARRIEKSLTVDKTIDAARGAHGNSRLSTKAQHGYEIVDTTTGEVVKTGVSGGRRTATSGSARANSQANRWNREAGQPGRYEPRVVQEVPAGPGARQQILEWETENAARLREAGHLTDESKHVRP